MWETTGIIWLHLIYHFKISGKEDAYLIYQCWASFYPLNFHKKLKEFVGLFVPPDNTQN